MTSKTIIHCKPIHNFWAKEVHLHHPLMHPIGGTPRKRRGDVLIPAVLIMCQLLQIAIKMGIVSQNKLHTLQFYYLKYPLFCSTTLYKLGMYCTELYCDICSDKYLSHPSLHRSNDESLTNGRCTLLHKHQGPFKNWELFQYLLDSKLHLLKPCFSSCCYVF